VHSEWGFPSGIPQEASYILPIYEKCQKGLGVKGEEDSMTLLHFSIFRIRKLNLMRKISSYLKASESTMLLMHKINQFIRDDNLDLK
jgi:hypothetical protein